MFSDKHLETFRYFSDKTSDIFQMIAAEYMKITVRIQGCFRRFSGCFLMVFRGFSDGFQGVFRIFSGGFLMVFRGFSVNSQITVTKDLHETFSEVFQKVFRG